MSNNIKVFVVGNDDLTCTMFKESDLYSVVERPEDCDLMVWTGGPDVNPCMYNEKVIKETALSNTRDNVDYSYYKNFRDKKKVGICRGGQFLNVVNGGKMIQHADNHTRPHLLSDTLSKKTYFVTSTHHQIMRPASGAIIVAITKKSTFWKTDKGTEEPKLDTEVIYYKDTKSLCFQPHPEYDKLYKGYKLDTHDYFFELLNRYHFPD